ncbi:MAG: nitroreductase [Methanosarcinales archaeon]|nr:nitroreductase [Methanosarcinales archaeon]
MNDVIEAIKDRRSIRQFEEDIVSANDIEFLIDCAIHAPSGLNTQPWSFLVINNKKVLHDLSERSKKALIPLIESMEEKPDKVIDFLNFLRSPDTSIFYDAHLLIIVLANKNVMTADYDCAMAAQNMMLAAHSVGLGSCWIGGAQPALMDEEYLKELGAPVGYKVVAPIIFGYPDGEAEMPERNEADIRWVR